MLAQSRALHYALYTFHAYYEMHAVFAVATLVMIWGYGEGLSLTIGLHSAAARLTIGP
ncbi:MAG TPA: hypothetical protein VIH84_03685 [Candidatus Methylomirabilis sp.]